MHPPSLRLAPLLLVLACGGAGDDPHSTDASTTGDLPSTTSTTTTLTSSSGTTALPTTGPASTGVADSTGPADSTGAPDTGDPPVEPIRGVTIDAIDPLPDILDALGALHRKPTTRVVFDEFVPAADYVDAVGQIAGVSFVMGELLDSFYVAQYSLAEYDARAEEYLDAMADVVDIWEIGNEINGEWVCAENADACTPEQTAAVVAKIQAAYDRVKARGEPAALTLYYNQDCWSAPDNEMFAWAAANVPAAMKQGLDYVLVSYYEDDCNGLQPDWPAVFAELRALFPGARLGVGECGTTDPDRKAEFVTRYYGMTIDDPGFVGGWFWWYFRQDMVPKTSPLWQVLDDALP